MYYLYSVILVKSRIEEIESKHTWWIASSNWMHVSRQEHSPSELFFKLRGKNDCIYPQGATVSLNKVFDCFAFDVAACLYTMDNKWGSVLGRVSRQADLSVGLALKYYITTKSISLIADRTEGRSDLPSIVRPDTSTACSCCSNTNWSEEKLGLECTVFLLARAAKVKFAEHTCESLNCNGKLYIDGIELAILRYTERTAFAHEVLWDWSHRVSTGGVTWFGHWRDTIARYSDPLAVKAWWQHRLRDAYEQATLDFIQLQRIDYPMAFSCDCPLDLVADGITLGYKLKHMFLVSLTDPPAEQGQHHQSSQHLVKGSLFKQRVFIRSLQMRKLLLQFCRQGLSELQHEELISHIEGDDEEASLLPYLLNPQQSARDETDGVFRPQARYKELLRILGTAAPVCQFLKPSVYDMCEKILDGQSLTAAEILSFSEHCPHLCQFLLRELSTNLRSDCLQLLANLLQVYSTLSWQASGFWQNDVCCTLNAKPFALIYDGHNSKLSLLWRTAVSKHSRLWW